MAVGFPGDWAVSPAPESEECRCGAACVAGRKRRHDGTEMTKMGWTNDLFSVMTRLDENEMAMAKFEQDAWGVGYVGG